MSAAQAASLVTATLIAAVIGGILFGILSDKARRVRVLTWTIVVFAVFTGLCAIAQDYWSLLLFRTLAGLGLGGEFGIGMAMVAEAWPDSMRARASSYVGLSWQAGVLAAAFVTPLLLPIIGWRGMFAVGMIPAIAAFFIRHGLDEPERFSAKVAERALSNRRPRHGAERAVQYGPRDRRFRPGGRRRRSPQATASAQLSRCWP